MNRRLGVALVVAFVLHALLFTLLHVRRGPAPQKPVAKRAPIELETTSVALGEAGGETAAAPSGPKTRRVVAGSPAVPAAVPAPSEPSPATAAASSPSWSPPLSPGGEEVSAGGDGQRGSEGPGSGGGAGKGDATGGGAGATPPTIDRGAVLRQILSRVRDARRYPDAARRRELEGTVHVRFTIGADGRPRSISTANGDPLLQAAAREAVERSAPLPPIDGPIDLDVDYTLTD